MATVNGLTAERMLAIEAASVVDGEIDGSGHLILTTHGGTEIDAGSALIAVPDASTSQKGIVEIATDVEIETGTDTLRAITPAGLASVGIPNLKLDVQSLTGRVDDHDDQLLDAFTRLADVEETQVIRLSPIDYEQSYSVAAYPEGESLLFLTGSDATSGGWGFGGKSGAVRTYRNSDEAYQTWQKVHGNTGNPELWIRGGNQSTGWSSWRVVVADEVEDTGWVNLTPASGWASSPTSSQHTAAVRRIGDVIRFRGVLSGSLTVATTTTLATVPSGYRPEKATNFCTVGNTSGFIGWANVSDVGALTVHFKTPFATGSTTIDLTGLSYLRN